jgi:hypothetical protein
MMWLVELVSSHTIVGCRKQNGPPSDRKMRVISDEWDPPITTLARKKTPAGKIARALKRTEGATRQKAFSLGLSLESRF